MAKLCHNQHTVMLPSPQVVSQLSVCQRQQTYKTYSGETKIQNPLDTLFTRCSGQAERQVHGTASWSNKAATTPIPWGCEVAARTDCQPGKLSCCNSTEYSTHDPCRLVPSLNRSMTIGPVQHCCRCWSMHSHRLLQAAAGSSPESLHNPEVLAQMS